MKGFCEKKFGSMLISWTFTAAVMYLMLLSDGDELCNNICYGFQIGGNILCSIILSGLMEARQEEKPMNVYDFDGTIFPGDCSQGFFFWCLESHPRLWYTYFPKTIKNLCLNQ